METLSDGVIAIAITLLVLEISVPEGSLDHLGKAILHEWPSYMAYVTSFMTIGAAWFMHHALFRRMKYVDGLIARVNLVFLMVVSFLPFPTKLLAESLRDVEAERVAVLFYGAILALMLLLMAGMCRYAATHRELLHENVTSTELDSLAGRIAPGVGMCVVVFALAIVAPRAAAFGFLIVAATSVISAEAGERE